jgi:hypothetical protein
VQTTPAADLASEAVASKTIDEDEEENINR